VEPWWKFRPRSVKWTKLDVALALFQLVLAFGFFAAVFAFARHSWGFLITLPLFLANAALLAGRLRLFRRRRRGPDEFLTTPSHCPGGMGWATSSRILRRS
jgi:hypothetical protein